MVQINGREFNFYHAFLPIGEKVMALTDKIAPPFEVGLSEINVGLIGLAINEVPPVAKFAALLTLAHGLTIFTKVGHVKGNSQEMFLA